MLRNLPERSQTYCNYFKIRVIWIGFTLITSNQIDLLKPNKNSNYSLRTKSAADEDQNRVATYVLCVYCYIVS